MGELELARRWTLRFGVDERGGVPSRLEESLEPGERAKLGIRKASMGLVRCGMLRPGLCMGTSFLSRVGGLMAVGVVGVVGSLPSTVTPSHTSCMPPFLLLLSSLPERSHMGRSGLPCFRSSYHIHWATKAQSTET